MPQKDRQAFPQEVVRELGTYVYRLIDPRNGETFYVGKGKGDRVFAHAEAETAKLDGDDVDNKLTRIRQIRLAGFEVAHVIHRHGMDNQTAIEVEAALIDAYPGLTNIAAGAGSNDRGPMHAREIVSRYAAEPAVFKHQAILITINRTAADASLYEATHYAWKISRSKARQAELVLPVVRGLIVGAFVPEHWLPATAENFPGREPSLGRFGFVGVEADHSVQQQYVGKRVPDTYRKRGAANPVRYTWR